MLSIDNENRSVIEVDSMGDFNGKQKVLVVDDDPQIVELITILLEDDYEICKAYSGKTAIEIAKKEFPAAVLLDYMMPGMTGLQVLHELRVISPFSYVVIITGQGSEQIAVDLMKAGAFDYIMKPFQNSQIMEVVRNLLKVREVSIRNMKLQEELSGTNERLQEIASSLEKSNILLQKRLREINHLQRFSSDINRVGELEIQLEQLLHSMEEHFSITSGFVCLFENEDPSAISISATHGILENKSLQEILSTDVVQCTLKTQEIILRARHRDKEFSSFDEKTIVSLVFPLLSDRKLYGLFYGETPDPHALDFENKDLFLTIANHVSIALQNAELYDQLSKSYLDTTFALATAVEAKDQVTQGHITRVTRYAILLGLALELEDTEIRTLQFGATLHDIGKIGIRDEILLKPGRLTDEEMTIIKQHPLIGEKIISNIEFLESTRIVVRNHHERWDGKGYPDGLSGEEIPLHARIISIVDVFDVLTHDRPYKKAMSWDAAIQELKDNAGTQFDPHLLQMFLDNLDTFPLMPKKRRISA